MIKAVIFDFFGVLAVRGSESFKQAHFPNDPTKKELAKNIHDKLGLGLIGYDEFITELATLGGVDRGTVLRYTEDYQPNTRLLNYIKNELKPQYKIGIISNAGEDWVLKILGPENYKLFDDIILSYKYSVIKPEPEIYKISAEHLGVREGECVFIDDIQTYCKGAEAVGMRSVWFRGFAQMKTDLQTILSPAADN
jgi:HAD superfamily hydrolase (TIGR01509 family)